MWAQMGLGCPAWQQRGSKMLMTKKLLKVSLM